MRLVFKVIFKLEVCEKPSMLLLYGSTVIIACCMVKWTDRCMDGQKYRHIIVKLIYRSQPFIS